MIFKEKDHNIKKTYFVYKIKVFYVYKIKLQQKNKVSLAQKVERWDDTPNVAGSSPV